MTSSDPTLGVGSLPQAGRLTRRRLLLRGAALGLSGPAVSALLTACGGGGAETTPTTGASSTRPPGGATSSTATTAASAAPTTAPTAGARAASPAVTASRGGQLVVAVEGDPGNMDPAKMFGLPPRRIGRTFYNALVSIDQTGKILPELAESWEQPDDHTYVLHLRKGIKFHDGTDFNAEAVKFHFDRHQDPKLNSLRSGELAAVAGAEVVDPYTIKVTLKQPFSPFLAALFDWSGFIVSPAAVEKYGDDYGFHPVGTGPFKFVSYTKDQETVVERNADYWESGVPYLDRITFRPVPVDSTRMTELRSGGVQIIENVPLQDASRLKDSTDIVISIKNGFRFNFFNFVSDKEPYGTNAKLRQAIAWAVDRDEVLKGVYFGMGAPGYQPFFPGTPFYDPNFKPYQRDIAKAKQLLSESGLPVPVQWQVFVNADPVLQRIAQVVQSQLAEVGIQLSIEQVDGATYNDHTLKWSDPFYLGSWWGWRPDPDQYLTTLMYSGSNKSNIKDPRIDDLLVKGRTVSDLQQRVDIYKQLRDIVSQEAYDIFYWEGPDIKGLSPKVQGFTHMPDSIIRYQTISLKS